MIMERLYWVGTPHEIIMHDPMNTDYHIGSIYQDPNGKVGFVFCQDPFLVFVVATKICVYICCVVFIIMLPQHFLVSIVIQNGHL